MYVCIMYVCVYVCVCVYVYACMHIYIYIYIMLFILYVLVRMHHKMVYVFYWRCTMKRMVALQEQLLT